MISLTSDDDFTQDDNSSNEDDTYEDDTYENDKENTVFSYIYS